ncbi:MAG: rhodanese-like domain-containing protein [Flavobacteriales bacterium]|nr:rhodanese-like domain-containing protein [Flavobacteriales bacterium]
MRSLTTAAFLFAGLFALAQTPATPRAITLAKEGALVVDVREPNELTQVAFDAPNVVNIPLGDVAKRANEIPKDKPVVVVCRSGGRSTQAIEELQKLGYTNLVNLEGGLYAWQEAGMPVKKGGTAAGACCAGGKAEAKGCGDGKNAANCTPEQKKAGCCSGAPKAAEPAPAEKQRKRKN